MSATVTDWPAPTMEQVEAVLGENNELRVRIAKLEADSRSKNGSIKAFGEQIGKLQKARNRQDKLLTKAWGEAERLRTCIEEQALKIEYMEMKRDELKARIVELEAASVPVAWRVTGRGCLTVTSQYPSWAEDDAELVIEGLHIHPQPQPAAVPEGWRVIPFSGSFKMRDERWEVYGPNGGGAVCEGEIANEDVCDLLDALAAAPQSPADENFSTTSDRYRAELYDEVWQKARDMGYGNVTMALNDLAKLKVAPQAPASNTNNY